MARLLRSHDLSMQFVVSIYHRNQPKSASPDLPVAQALGGLIGFGSSFVVVGGGAGAAFVAVEMMSRRLETDEWL